MYIPRPCLCNNDSCKSPPLYPTLPSLTLLHGTRNHEFVCSVFILYKHNGRCSEFLSASFALRPRCLNSHSPDPNITFPNVDSDNSSLLLSTKPRRYDDVSRTTDYQLRLFSAAAIRPRTVDVIIAMATRVHKLIIAIVVTRGRRPVSSIFISTRIVAPSRLHRECR